MFDKLLSSAISLTENSMVLMCFIVKKSISLTRKNCVICWHVKLPGGTRGSPIAKCESLSWLFMHYLHSNMLAVSETRQHIFCRDLTSIIPTKFVSNWPSRFRGDYQNVQW